MTRKTLTKATKRRLLLLIALGGLCGASAALVPAMPVRLGLVSLAACLGVYAPAPDGHPAQRRK